MSNLSIPSHLTHACTPRALLELRRPGVIRQDHNVDERPAWQFEDHARDRFDTSLLDGRLARPDQLEHSNLWKVTHVVPHACQT
jgi:hypothetical protein